MEIERRDIFTDIKNIIDLSKKKIVSSINSTMTTTYFLIGKRIVEEEQGGVERAEYGENLIIKLSERLTKEYGKGFSKRNLWQMKKFYLSYQKVQTVSAEFKLSYSHYLTLMRITNIEERNFYEIEAINNNWSLRELKRQIDSALYERLVLSRDKEKVIELSKKGQLIEKPQDIVKDPYILEFLGLDEKSVYSENELETAIINHIEKFIMELGKGFLFQGRQVRFTFDEEHFFVDLVFYNRLLKCFVLIDLKIGKLKHQDIGQMQMYVNYYDRHVKLDDENKTIGIIICKDKNDTLVNMTLPEGNEQIFASRYMTILPSKEELKKIVESEVRE
ncbi:MAG: PDDEXK nuclease domain-containing protein [Fusobacterium perfoetens]|uniref:PDDEXK nuclease domain-containing protein n=1 Tax=Fusobacterium perfoetens TaxID=852 RepID=UPI0023F03E85|nr:PDDEXK nuclease domain-containing protein [Fusobacterium perfoetens]MCI6151971.1 PDDEXK nuclease domain-containing protein [Fusobacterium perfoetens]MDY3237884.1 PDDEXK nuclease domain-containing protein [Fusobacterium perfoetens]